MPSKLIFIDKKRKEYLDISWIGSYKNLEIKTKQQHLIFKNREELINGVTFTSDSGKEVTLKIVKHLRIFSELDISLYGLPIEGSNNHPAERMKKALFVLFALCGINIIAGCINLIFDLEISGIGTYNFIFAAALLLFSLAVYYSKNDLVAYALVFIVSLDIISTIFILFESEKILTVLIILFIKLIFLIAILPIINVCHDYKKLTNKLEQIRKEEEDKRKKTPLSEQVTEDHSKYSPKDYTSYQPKTGE